jgi:hypothetical protein
MRKTAALLAMLMLCACQGRERLYAVPLPPPPVDTTRQVGPEMLPWLRCLNQQGSYSQACRAMTPQHGANKPTSTAPKS